MENPAEAHMALWEEWPSNIAKLLDRVLWAEVTMRSEKQIVRNLRALNKCAHDQSKAVSAFIKEGLSTQQAVDRVLAAANRKS